MVNLQFDGRGADIFSELTQRIAGVETKRIAVFMDDRGNHRPSIPCLDPRRQHANQRRTSPARRPGLWRSSWSRAACKVPLKLIQQSDVEARYWGRSRLAQQPAGPGWSGSGLVLVFMVAYYRMAGVVAAFALVFYAVMVLAVFKLIPITLELAHIGGFILSVGMAVDANILIFERMKEEVRIGRTLASSMEVGFSRAWPAIRDSNISTMITCLVLLWFGDRLGGGTGHRRRHQPVHRRGGQYVHRGGGEPQLAATAGLRGAGTADQPVYSGVGSFVRLRAGEPNRGRGPAVMDVVGKRAWYFLFSALIIIPGIVSMLLPPGWVSLGSGLRPGIDFTSGSVLNVTFTQRGRRRGRTIQERMTALGHPEALVQLVGANNYFIRTDVLEEAVGGRAVGAGGIILRDLAEERLGSGPQQGGVRERIAHRGGGNRAHRLLRAWRRRRCSSCSTSGTPSDGCPKPTATASAPCWPWCMTC